MSGAHEEDYGSPSVTWADIAPAVAHCADDLPALVHAFIEEIVEVADLGVSHQPVVEAIASDPMLIERFERLFERLGVEAA